MNYDKTIFLIRCSTGCSCCANENHYRGPFSARTIAESKVREYHKIPVLASQYSKTGHYDIEEHDATIINGIIIADTEQWFEGFADNKEAGDQTEQLTKINDA